MKWTIALLLLLMQFSAIGQSDQISSYFGIQYKSILPNNFVGSKILKLSEQEFSSTCEQKVGYLIGATVRAGITKLIAFETGINLVHRNFQIDMSVPDSNLYAQTDLSLLSYDIPLNCLIYIKLSKAWYSNASLGFSMVYKPSMIQSVTGLNYGHVFTYLGATQRKFSADFNANIGFEFRSKTSGFFYLGGSARIPLEPLFILAGQYRNEGYSLLSYGDINGSFISIDLKYFFPNTKSNGSTFRPGPIE
ncbi:MAG: hypothetical protein QNK70_03645 [Crocinitomicaceae bacterium]|tara:strand:+ start:753 stop:1499 length:747 start_codon:yes stop_codon:yes gene_type:complete